MRLMLDLNVLLDIVQRREPFYAASAAVLSRVVDLQAEGLIPGHAVTTLHYIVGRVSGREKANELVDWLLSQMEVVPEGKEQFLRARNLSLDDFEDAVVASAAESGRCDWIITRNVPDFEGAPVPALTPEEFLVSVSSSAS